MPLRISVIVPAYNRPDNLLSLLKSLEAQTYRDFEVIVVVDGVKETLKAAQGYKASYQLIVKYIDNSGCQVARNVGIREAEGDILAFTDDDCIPDLKWLEHGIKYFGDKKLVGVEGAIYSDPPRSLAYNTVELTKRSFVTEGKTANMLYRKSVLEAVGCFDEAFTIRTDRGIIGFRGDTDLAWRVERHGKVVFAEDVLVYHPIRPITVRKLLQETKLYKNSAVLLFNHPERWWDILKLNFIPSRFLAVPLLPFKAFWFAMGLFGEKNAHCTNPR